MKVSYGNEKENKIYKEGER